GAAHRPWPPARRGAMSAPVCDYPPGHAERRVSPGWLAAGNSDAPFGTPAAAGAHTLQSLGAAAPAPRLLPAGLPGYRAPAAPVYGAVPPAAGSGGAPGSRFPESAIQARAP